MDEQGFSKEQILDELRNPLPTPFPSSGVNNILSFPVRTPNPTASSSATATKLSEILDAGSLRPILHGADCRVSPFTRSTGARGWASSSYEHWKNLSSRERERA